MHSVRFGRRFGFLAGTALALILTASTTAAAAPVNANAPPAPQPAARDYSTPGSMPKPSSVIDPADNGIRFRGLPPSSGSAPPPRRDSATPLAPASNELRAEEPAKPAAAVPAARTETPAAPRTVTGPPRAEAEPQPAVNAAPPPAPAPAPAPAAKAAPTPEPVARPAAARPAAVEAAPNAASEAEVGKKLREIIASRQFERVIARKPDRDAIVALYQKGRSFQPLWVAQGAPSERARDVMEYLRTIDADGLDSKDYPLPRLNVGSADAQAEAELKFTETLLTDRKSTRLNSSHIQKSRMPSSA